MASIGGAFGGNRGMTPVPPEKGVFPLDHLHECDEAMKTYMRCLKESSYDAENCRHLSKVYLECRMERNLMARQDLAELGFKDDGSQMDGANSAKPSVNNVSPAHQSHEKLRGGFVSGIPRSAGNSR
ncbi:unnamed protein product [Calypogeia fissa]